MSDDEYFDRHKRGDEKEGNQKLPDETRQEDHKEGIDPEELYKDANKERDKQRFKRHALYAAYFLTAASLLQSRREKSTRYFHSARSFRLAR